MSKNPTAFPYTTAAGTTGFGMTLRDYFAAKAMQSLILRSASGTVFGDGDGAANNRCAHVAYIMADAMLEARK